MSSASFADNGKWIKEIIYCWSSKKFFPVRERLNVINVSPLTLAETQTRRYKAVILLAKNNYLNLLEWCQIYGQSSRVSWICFRILILMNNNLLAYQFVHNYYYYCNVPLAIIIDRDLPQGCLEWTNGIWDLQQFNWEFRYSCKFLFFYQVDINIFSMRAYFCHWRFNKIINDLFSVIKFLAQLLWNNWHHHIIFVIL